VIRFHVNIDHVATIRNARGTAYPDPVRAAELALASGADGITLHLREDRRHIRDDDVERMRALVKTLMNLEMAATDEMIGIAARVRPDVITLVPERREERTTEGGLDVVRARGQIEKAARMCAENGIKLSLFIEADEAAVRFGKELGARQVELHTGEYCDKTGAAQQAELDRLRVGAKLAQSLGLEVAAGHGLTRENVVAVAAIPEVEELNIGHAVIADAVFAGLPRAIEDFRAAVARGEGAR